MIQQVDSIEIDWMEPAGSELIAHYVNRIYFNCDAHDLLLLAEEDLKEVN